MRYLLAFLLLPTLLYASPTYTSETADGDGYYANVVGAINKRTVNFGFCTRVAVQYHTESGNETYTIGNWSWSTITSSNGGYAVACTLFTTAKTVTAGGNISTYVQMKPYFEGNNCNSAFNGSSTWDEWYQHSTGSLDTLFTTKGNVTPPLWGSQGSTFNRSDATGHDRTASAMATVNVTTTGAKAFVVDTLWFNKFMRGEIPQLTVLGVPASGTEIQFQDNDDPDISGGDETVMHIWWGDPVTPPAPTRGTGRFGKSTTGAYLNDR